MPFCLLWEFFPELAEKETRTVILPEAHDGLPAGAYSFMEMFCDEKDCDCRRVFFSVEASFRKGPEAVIAWGWESKSFYKKWLRGSGPDSDAALLQGPVLNMGSPQTALAPHLLKLFETLLLTDIGYTERVKRHYATFRKEVESREAGAPDGGREKPHRDEGEPAFSFVAPKEIGPAVRPGPRIGRNAPCPCGSGKKYKKCCGAGMPESWLSD
ncbi:MAG: SEC-C metal-binding domain-containing protein [Kiritimatiellia bacterium]